jgi:hypothetical protein
MSADVPGLVQHEDMFTISRITPATFTGSIRTVRNILVVEISDKYVKQKIAYRKDVWAKSQAVVVITAPNNEAFLRILDEYQDDICEFFVAAERERMQKYYRKHYNLEATKKVKEQFGAELYVPNTLTKFKSTEDFFWASNMSLDMRQDIIIYSYPYTDPNTFTEQFLLAKRDSVLKYNLPGPNEGSYVGTQYKLLPVSKVVKKNERYCLEIRGWWHVKNGDLMGGPFISHTQLDEINQRVITIEGFVYAPEFNKRSYIRQLEAVVYSMKLPQDLVPAAETAE